MHETASRSGNSIALWYTWVFLAVLPSTVLTRTIGTGAVNLLLLASFIIAMLHYRLYKILGTEEKKLILLSSSIFLYTVGTGFFLQMESNSRYVMAIEYQLVLLLPLSIIYSIRSGWLKADFETFKTAIAVAAVIAGLCAFYDMATGIADRYARLHGQPIVYGDLSMLFGLISLVLWLDESQNNRKKILYLSAFVLGSVGSLYSGSRGGWIGLPMVAWLFWKWKIIDRRLMIRFFLIAATVTIALALSENPVKHRIFEAISDLRLYNQGDSSTPIGTRFEMWKVAWQGFLASPVFGIGLGEFYAYKMEMIRAGFTPDYVMKYKSPHNEYFNILFSFGAIGIVLYGWLFGWLWKVFSQLVEAGKDKAVNGRIGQLVMIAFLDFSLSEVMVSTKLGGAVFYLLCSVLIAYAFSVTAHSQHKGNR